MMENAEMPLRMPLEMRKLRSFPIEKLCYDLKLEVLEQMEPDDAIELAKVNAGFRSILLRTPWIVFGHHVSCIENQEFGAIWILKLDYYDASEYHDPTLHLLLTKRIRSCLQYCVFYWNDEHTTILANQLESVKDLELTVYKNEVLLKFFENYGSMIEESAYFYGKVDLSSEVIKELFKHFIANQMSDCKRVRFYCFSTAVFYFYYDAFVRTSVKFLQANVERDVFEEVVQLIVKKPIPSKNLQAAFYVDTKLYSQEMHGRIIDFLSQFPGMKPSGGVTKMANELLEKHLINVRINFTEKSNLVFRRNIDSNRDCVYMFESDRKYKTQFLAFYVLNFDFE